MKRLLYWLYLLEMAENKDITVSLHHLMDFGKSFSVKIINEGKRKSDGAS